MLKFFQVKRGSVLVFSLIILSIMLSAALTITAVTLSNRKSAGSTAESVQSFQVADSGVEQVLRKIYKGSYTTISTLDASCVSGVVSFSVSGGTVKVTFLDENGNFIDCNDSAWRSRLTKIKAEGTITASGTTRVIETAVAAVSRGVVGGCMVNAAGGSTRQKWGSGCKDTVPPSNSDPCTKVADTGYSCGLVSTTGLDHLCICI